MKHVIPIDVWQELNQENPDGSGQSAVGRRVWFSSVSGVYDYILMFQIVRKSNGICFSRVMSFGSLMCKFKELSHKLHTCSDIVHRLTPDTKSFVPI